MPLNAPIAGPTLPRRSRRATVTRIATLVVVGIGGGLWVAGLDSQQRTGRDLVTRIIPRPESTTPMSFHVETSVFRFDMPDTPQFERVAVPTLGVELAGKAWKIETDSMVLQVLAIDYQQAIDPTMAQTGFDSLVQGIATRTNGVVLTDEPIQLAGGSGRRSELEIDGGWVFTENYARGSWLVSMSVFSSSESPPIAYVNLMASFEFL